MKTIILTLFLCFLLFPQSKTTAQGFEIYLVNKSYPNPDLLKAGDSCLYCFNPDKTILHDTALIVETDIEYFDWNNQTITLKESGVQKLGKLKIPLQGLAVALCIDKEPVYGFWLWNMVSSFGCDYICAFIQPSSNSLKLEAGLPNNWFKAIDPRQNEKLKKFLKEKGILK
jgi:hypothetical protein